MIIFKKCIVFILVHRFDFPVIEYFTMKELSTFSKVRDTEMDSCTVCNFTCFMVGVFYLFDDLDDRADMGYSIVIKSSWLIDKYFSLYPLIGLLY